ncbi:hypothetical protein [Sphingomonas psychrotolerans]|uniref:hypothetical protein n=1 Tax=Sphingomonas psychrotolerans TaxID=1327635 RepID=UPI0018F6B39B|nr:hypothetical protein [Sphingomonas psychrotolerans]
MLQVFALAIAAFALPQTAPVAQQRPDAPQPTPTATPTDTPGTPAGKSINEAGPQGPAPSRPKPRPTTTPGVKFRQ